MPTLESSITSHVTASLKRIPPAIFSGGFELLSISDSVLAQKLGVGQPTISAWHRGAEPIPHGRREQLHNALAIGIECARQAIAEATFEVPTAVGSQGLRQWVENVQRAQKTLEHERGALEVKQEGTA